MWRRARFSRIALDPGLASVRACQLVERRGRVHLHQLAGLTDRCANPAAAAAAERTGACRAARLVQQLDLHGREAAVAAPAGANFQVLDVPSQMFGAPDQEWRTMLRFEAARQTATPPDELEVAAWPLPDNRRDVGRVMVAALPHEQIRRTHAQVAQAGLTLCRIDALPLALVRAGVRAGVPGGGDPATSLWGVLELGAQTAVLTIAFGRQCVFVRPLGIAGVQLTQALADGLELDLETAETLKYDCVCSEETAALTARPAATGATTIALDTTTAARVVRARLRTLTAEIRRAFTYVIEAYADAVPAGLYLTGGATRLGGLAASLSDSLGILVQPLTPRMALRDETSATTPDLDDQGFTAAVGLALGDLT